jgi:dipeptidyl aminopeptidase/acylaminoacyl peptidase
VVDTYSTTTVAPVSVLRDANDGKVLAEDREGRLTRLKARGWVAPEPIVVKARDGKTDLYGMMFKPSNFDPNKKYPIVNYVYPGPQVGSVRSYGFLSAHGDNQALAELGFIVVAIDGMGTPYRSKAFHDAYAKDIGDNTLPDQVTGMKQLAQRFPFIDLTRAGIWGHSGGGNATGTAMFKYRTSSRSASRKAATTTTATTKTTGRRSGRACWPPARTARRTTTTRPTRTMHRS